MLFLKFFEVLKFFENFSGVTAPIYIFIYTFILFRHSFPISFLVLLSTSDISLASHIPPSYVGLAISPPVLIFASCLVPRYLVDF